MSGSKLPSVESKRERMKKLNCLTIQRKGKLLKLIYERERRKTQCWLPKLEPYDEYQCRALLLAMGAGEADGGRRGQSREARLVGAGEANGGRKPPAT